MTKSNKRQYRIGAKPNRGQKGPTKARTGSRTQLNESRKNRSKPNQGGERETNKRKEANANPGQRISNQIQPEPNPLNNYNLNPAT
jgi:hypothetical protein